jgi:hypothetical protein
MGGTPTTWAENHHNCCGSPYLNEHMNDCCNWEPSLTMEEVRELRSGAAANAAADEGILLEAHKLINGARRQHYGDQYTNFGDIAALWSAYLDQPISRTDVANLMILLKLARTKRLGYHQDSYVDIAGYAGCAEKVHQAILERTPVT